MGIRRKRKDRILADQRQSRKDNGTRKENGLARRMGRMKKLIKAGKYPYTPVVMSWLSQAMGKPSSQITQVDIDRLLAASKA